ncbi:MAG: hypothetical protein FRX49_01523 [Trebouxia sp. A1-2]|nr:MAG: hypothetical protein FRX49_01523 [Trebouxia sp. A1-2]
MGRTNPACIPCSHLVDTEHVGYVSRQCKACVLEKAFVKVDFAAQITSDQDAPLDYQSHKPPSDSRWATAITGMLQQSRFY